MSGVVSGNHALEQDLFNNECLLQNILAYLQPQHLPPCALVNSQWYHFVAEQLYRKVPLKRQILLPQIFSIGRNPQLGSFVRELRIDSSKLRHNVYISEEFRDLMSALCQSCVNLQRLWFTYNRKEDSEWLAMLIHNAPGLTYLNFDVVNKSNAVFGSLINVWENLETLEITHSTSNFIRESDDFTRVLKTHSKLTHIVIMGDVDIPDILMQGLSENCSKLRSLTLGSRHSFGSFSLSEKALSTLVKNTPELRTLNLGTTDSNILLQGVDWLSDVGNHCKELKCLRWNVSLNPNVFQDSSKFKALLRPFSSLTTLNISGLSIHFVFAMIEEASHLSHTLSTLVLKEVGESEQVEKEARLLSYIPILFPNLSHLELHCYLNQILNRCVPNILKGLEKLEVAVISAIGAVLEDEDVEGGEADSTHNPSTHVASWFEDELQHPLHLTSLRFLKLESIRVTNQLINALSHSCPNLAKLYILSYFSRIYTPIDFSVSNMFKYVAYALLL
ncbi:hypothetical protein K7432_013600 [Basidiobolus ranarum]|uniref:F-box domain-containing protein n=1 Tax=Basidiobolus ranarum TaxID=34480 RepID=A0ABR2WIZ6_9FUNG